MFYEFTSLCPKDKNWLHPREKHIRLLLMSHDVLQANAINNLLSIVCLENRHNSNRVSFIYRLINTHNVPLWCDIHSLSAADWLLSLCQLFALHHHILCFDFDFIHVNELFWIVNDMLVFYLFLVILFLYVSVHFCWRIAKCIAPKIFFFAFTS